MLKPVPLTVELADNVVKAPVPGVMPPMFILLIVPAVVVGPIVTVLVLLGCINTLPFAGLSVTAPLAVSVVNAPVLAVVAPTEPLTLPLMFACNILVDGT